MVTDIKMAKCTGFVQSAVFNFSKLTCTRNEFLQELTKAVLDLDHITNFKITDTTDDSNQNTCSISYAVKFSSQRSPMPIYKCILQVITKACDIHDVHKVNIPNSISTHNFINGKGMMTEIFTDDDKSTATASVIARLNPQQQHYTWQGYTIKFQMIRKEKYRSIEPHAAEACTQLEMYIKNFDDIKDVAIIQLTQDIYEQRHTWDLERQWQPAGPPQRVQFQAYIQSHKPPSAKNFNRFHDDFLRSPPVFKGFIPVFTQGLGCTFVNNIKAKTAVTYDIQFVIKGVFEVAWPLVTRIQYPGTRVLSVNKNCYVGLERLGPNPQSIEWSLQQYTPEFATALQSQIDQQQYAAPMVTVTEHLQKCIPAFNTEHANTLKLGVDAIMKQGEIASNTDLLQRLKQESEHVKQELDQVKTKLSPISDSLPGLIKTLQTNGMADSVIGLEIAQQQLLEQELSQEWANHKRMLEGRRLSNTEMKAQIAAENIKVNEKLESISDLKRKFKALLKEEVVYNRVKRILTEDYVDDNCRILISDIMSR